MVRPPDRFSRFDAERSRVGLRMRQCPWFRKISMKFAFIITRCLLNSPLDPKRFCDCVLAIVVSCLLAIATLNWAVNPYGQYSSNGLAAILGCRGFEADLGRSILTSTGFLVTLASLVFCWLAPNTWNFQPRLTLGTAFLLSALLVVCILQFDGDSPFLYFQF